MSLSTFLNGRDPTRLRGLQMLALSEQGTLLALTSTSDSGGGATQTWGTAGTVSCRIDPLAATGPGLTGGRIEERSTHIVTVPSGTDVPLDGRFVMTGGTFEITALRNRTAGLTVRFEVIQIT